MKKLFLIVLSILTIFSAFSVTGFASASNSSSEIVIELNSNRVLFENNAREKKYMASTTKILTALCVIENSNLDDKVTITKKTIGIEGSSIYLEEGEILTVRELLYGLMLRSGNDCAETLACYCSGTIEEFALLMNQTANKIGALDSNFVNPHGLHNDNHYTTAYDLALISSYAMKNQDFREIVQTKVIDISFSTRDYNRRLVNKNKMLKEFEGSTGIKTGYTKKAGRCLVSSCYRDGMELICVVLNCPPMFERSKNLLTQCFNYYSNYKIIESDHIFDFIDIENSDKKVGVICLNDVTLPLTKEEKNNLKIVCDYPKKLSLPIKKGENIGLIKIYIENNLLFEEKIYTIVDVK